MADKPIIAILGGTGALGSALALRWAKAGYDVIVGSRQADKAEAAAAEIATRAGRPLRAMDNRAAATAGAVVVLTVPHASQKPILEEVKAAVQGKIFIDATVPLKPPQVTRVQLPPEGSAAKAAQMFLGAGVKVVSAFHNVAAERLRNAGAAIDCDVLVAGDDADARQAVVELAEAAGLKGWHVGPLDNSAVAEALTSALIFINRRYGIDGAGIRITGQPKPKPDKKPA